VCGICGKLNLDNDLPPVTRSDIHAMCRPIIHRGPDDEGIFADGVAGIGIRRLSIIDLETGGQPIHNEDNSIWTVVNGELYNFREIRRDLEALGHRFYTNSDTEIVSHLYEEYGTDFLKRVNGMFGIALWDARTRTLVLARDRIGIKPLHYSYDGRTLLFGTELKSMLAAGMDRETDAAALSDYLSYNYIPAPRTIYRAASKLEPGHMLIARNGAIRLERYWDLPTDVDAPGCHSEDEYCEMIRETLKTSIRRRLMSDVPLGVFLSGGVDSTATVALASEVSSEPIRTFTIDFGEKSFSEIDNARLIAQRYQTIHREQVLQMRPLEVLPVLARLLDEPFADSSTIPTYYVAKMARENVTVALGGDGGDELFAGYHTYTAGSLNAFYRRLPGIISRHALPWAIRRLPVSHKKDSWDFKAKKFVQGALNDPARAHFMWKVIFDEQQKRALCPFAAAAAADPFDAMGRHFERYSMLDNLRQWQFVDTKVYLPDDILTKVDRMTMGNSLEGRVPFLDHEFVEMAARIPSRLKMKYLMKKYILKRAMQGHLPHEVLFGKKKGFSVPMARWLRNELKPMVMDYLSPARLRNQGMFDAEAVAGIVEAHDSMQVDYSRNIWGLLSFMLWHEQYGRCAAPSASGAGRSVERELIEVT